MGNCNAGTLGLNLFQQDAQNLLTMYHNVDNYQHEDVRPEERPQCYKWYPAPNSIGRPRVRSSMLKVRICSDSDHPGCHYKKLKTERTEEKVVLQNLTN